ncbi:MAG: hypothetical protein J5606_03935 [Bacteroidales bacterium]|nr:hypothetical protein [Bacteroidales bacterium]
MTLIIFSCVAYGQNELVQKAQETFKQGKYSDAANLYEQAAKIANMNGNTSLEKTYSQQKNKANQCRNLLSAANKFYSAEDWSNALTKYRALQKLNANDPTAKKRIPIIENKQKALAESTIQTEQKPQAATAITQTKNTNQQSPQRYNLDVAMQKYNLRQYDSAVAYFEKALPATQWGNAEQIAYNRAKEEVLYIRWKSTENTAEKITTATALVDAYPSSVHITEVKAYLLNYYKQNKQYDLAIQYATSDAQRQSLIQQRDNANKKKTTPYANKNATSNSNADIVRYSPIAFGIGAEIGYNGTYNWGVPVEMRFLKPSIVNFSLGFRAGQVIKPYDEAYVAADGLNYRNKYSYWQLSPFVHVDIRFSKNHEKLHAILGVGGKVDINTGFDLQSASTGGSNGQYKSQSYQNSSDLLSPVTFSLRGDFGMGTSSFKISLFVDWYIKQPFAQEKIEKLALPENLGQSVYATKLGTSMQKRVFYGLTASVYLFNKNGKLNLKQ